MTTTLDLQDTRAFAMRTMTAFAPIRDCACGHAHHDHTYFPNLYPCRKCVCQQFAEERASEAIHIG